jgi:uncharacterized membrane protein
VRQKIEPVPWSIVAIIGILAVLIALGHDDVLLKIFVALLGVAVGVEFRFRR